MMAHNFATRLILPLDVYYSEICLLHATADLNPELNVYLISWSHARCIFADYFVCSCTCMFMDLAKYTHEILFVIENKS